MRGARESDGGGGARAAAPLLGAIADDVTGATDLAAYLVRAGMPVTLFFGVPRRDAEVPGDARCVVIALKTRSIEPAEAVAQSLAAEAWLRGRGVEHVYLKYCSTFDSTSRGNIGPVLDALAEAAREPLVVVAPSAPENGRTVYQGRLFVGEQLLEESPLRDHPITPMRDSLLVRLLAAQSSRRATSIGWQTVAAGVPAVRAAFAAQSAAGGGSAVVDAIADADLDTIAAAIRVDGHRLSSGSAGLGAALGRALRTGAPVAQGLVLPEGPAVVLSGSCSAATRAQVARYRASHPAVLLNPLRLAREPAALTEIVDFVRANLERAPLVYATAEPARVAQAQAELGIGTAASLVERALAEVARAARALGATRFVTAGGESSGAVIGALGIEAVGIGPEVAPGVPWCLSVGEPRLAVVLKSGNFGGPDFFEAALGPAGR